MKLFHRHDWRVKWVQQGSTGRGYPITLIGYKCPCGRIKTAHVGGHWGLADLR